MPSDSSQPHTFEERDAWLRAVLASELSHVAARVAVRIGLYLNVGSGQCNPGIGKIAIGSKISERSAYRQVALLEQVGWIEIKHGGGRKRSNHYVLKYPDIVLAGFSTENPDSGDNETLTVVTINPATTVADKKRLTAKRTSVADTDVSATGERERSRSLAVIPGAHTPYGGALREFFETLLAIWDRPYGEDRTAVWTALLAIYTPDVGDELLASARRWKAAKPRDKLQKLEVWLRNGAWRKLPPSPRPERNAGKASMAAIARAVGRRDGDRS